MLFIVGLNYKSAEKRIYAFSADKSILTIRV
jgi:hypothetical protein